MSTSSPSTLVRLFAANRARFHHTYRDGLTNHAAMALAALAELGADDTRLTAFFEDYQRRLDPVVADPALAAMERDVVADRDGAIRKTCDALVADVAGGAFHGVIRLAWAITASERTGDQGDIAHALRAFASEADDDNTGTLPPAPSAGTTDLVALLDRLRDTGVRPPEGRLISSRIHTVRENPAFVAIANDVAANDDTLDAVAAFGAGLYLMADDFASLHVITGADALILLRPFFSTPNDAARAAVRAALGCAVLAGAPALHDGSGLPTDDDVVIAAAAIAVEDDHVPKLVCSCRRHFARTKNPIFRAVATRVSRRGTS